MEHLKYYFIARRASQKTAGSKMVPNHNLNFPVEKQIFLILILGVHLAWTFFGNFKIA